MVAIVFYPLSAKNLFIENGSGRISKRNLKPVFVDIFTLGLLSPKKGARAGKSEILVIRC